MIATTADQDARSSIHDDLDKTLFVEAGAGTGKTHELIEPGISSSTPQSHRGNGEPATTTTTRARVGRFRRRYEREGNAGDLPSDCRAAAEPQLAVFANLPPPTLPRPRQSFNTAQRKT